MQEEVEQGEDNNERGNDSGSDRGGSVGKVSGSGSGSGTDGSNGSADGSGGEPDGSGGSVNGSDGRSGDSADSDSGVNATPTDSGQGDAHRNAVRRTRADRIREQRTIRLGDIGDRTTSADAGAATGAAEGRAESDTQAIPVIRLGAKGKGRPKEKVEDSGAQSSAKPSELKEYISVFLDSAFNIPAVALKQDFWNLDKEENKQLTGAIVAYIDSLPKAKSSWLAQFIQEHFPLINLAMIAFFIVSDRVSQSMTIAQAERYSKSQFAKARNAAGGAGFEGFGGRTSTDVADNIH